jgi:hypothetical protein
MDDSYSNRDDDIEQFGAEEQSDGSYLTKCGHRVWYNEKGEYHREDGPAIIYHDDPESWWWLNNIDYCFNDWCIELNKSDEDKMLLRLQYE